MRWARFWALVRCRRGNSAPRSPQWATGTSATGGSPGGAQAGARGCPGLDAHRGLVAFLSDPARKPGSAFETRHMGSGIYRYGKCGRKMYAAYPHGKGTPMLYVCKPTAHVGRLGEPLDEYVETLVLGDLSDPETRAAVDGDAGRQYG